MPPLRTQINPHFIFNALGSFRNDIEDLSPKLANDLKSIMDIMDSAMVRTGNDGMILLKREIETVESLISIYKRRFPEINIVYQKSISHNVAYKILPHVLMTFVENSFKYGAFYDPEKSIIVQIKENGGNLTFATFNKKVGCANDDSTGIGIPLIKRHLSSGYGDRHTLVIHDDEDEFSVLLQIRELDKVDKVVTHRKTLVHE